MDKNSSAEFFIPSDDIFIETLHLSMVIPELCLEINLSLSSFML